MNTASPRKIARYLSSRDPKIKRIVERVGIHPLPKTVSGFRALVRAIVYQQISGAAGRSIMRRLQAASGGRGVPGPRWFAEATDATLRAAGLSPQKQRYIRDLAGRTESGTLAIARLPHLEDGQVVEQLTAVNGIGEWTAQMYLIFSLQRPDVLPSGDLGIRKAVQQAYGFRSLPAPRTIARLAGPWRPYRSHAAHYLWRSLETSPPGAR